MKRRSMILILAAILLTGCGTQATPETEPAEQSFEPVTASVTKVNQFGDVFLDMKEIDLAYGDSVNISCSNGYEGTGLPYYSDFFGPHDAAVLTDILEDLCIGSFGSDFARTAQIKEGDTITITLDERGKYKDMQDAYNVDPNYIQRDDQSEADFINAREVSAGEIREGLLYRGSSPFDSKFNRVALMEDYLKEKGITYVLNLADSPEKLLEYENLPEYTADLLHRDQVKALHLGNDFTLPEAMSAIREGMIFLSENEGPFLVHCSIGRDRTGFICALLEALCGASFDEILDDYMLTYDNLHDIDMNPDSLQYQLFADRLYEMFELDFGLNKEEAKTADLREAARGYLIRCGMTDDEIDQLTRRMTETNPN